MKKGDLLLCNDGKTKVEIVSFDENGVNVLYEGTVYHRAKNCLGKSLHYINHCWNCGQEVSSLFSTKCNYCGWYICNSCGSCCQGECKYHAFGFDENGIHRNGTRFSYAGYDIDGYDKQGFNNLGYDRDGYNRDGYNTDGYDRNGYNNEGQDRDGYNKMGYNSRGFDREGFDKSGYNTEGFNRDGIHLNGTLFSDCGYDVDGFDRDGYNKQGFDRKGFDSNGFNRKGFDRYGYDRNGFNRQGFDRDGYDRNGFNCQGFDHDGYDKDGFHKTGYNREGYNILGFNKEGIHRNGTKFDSNGYDFEGYNRRGFNKKGIHRNGTYYNDKGFDSQGFRKKWKRLVGKTAVYRFSDGKTKSGTIANLYRSRDNFYVDLEISKYDIIEKIDFRNAFKKGKLELLKPNTKSSRDDKKTHNPSKNEGINIDGFFKEETERYIRDEDNVLEKYYGRSFSEDTTNLGDDDMETDDFLVSPFDDE